MCSCVLGNVLKWKCKPLPPEHIPLVCSLPEIKLKLKEIYSKLSDPCGLDKSLTLLLNLLLSNTLLNKCINMFSPNLNLNILMLLNSLLPLPLDIWLVSSVPLFLTLLILWFLNWTILKKIKDPSLKMCLPSIVKLEWEDSGEDLELEFSWSVHLLDSNGGSMILSNQPWEWELLEEDLPPKKIDI